MIGSISKLYNICLQLQIIFSMLNSIKGLFSGKKAEPRQNKPYEGGIRLLKPIENGNKVVAVIVSFVNGSSYDHLFTSVDQKAEEGTQVLVYAAQSPSVSEILRGLRGQSEDAVVKELTDHIKSLDSDCVVFNWECCSNYSEAGFAEGDNSVFQFVDEALKRGFMLMFSDFSLKALVAKWDSKILGPNPFRQVNTYGGNFTLSFDCSQLRDCPSAQLQIIGEMAGEGKCNVMAAGGTIVYGVNKQHKNDHYDLEVLTVCSSIQVEQKYRCKIGDKSGAAGHVLLKFKKGGFILTSMGHWVELMKIDTSEKTLFEVAEREYGQVEAKRMREEYEVLDISQKQSYISRNAVEFVQKQAPCTNMARKKRG